MECRIVNGDEGECENGGTHGSHGESNRRESRSSGITVEFNLRDDTKVGNVIGEKISYYKHSHN